VLLRFNSFQSVKKYPVLCRTPYSSELFAIVNTLTSAFALVDEEFDIRFQVILEICIAIFLLHLVPWLGLGMHLALNASFASTLGLEINRLGAL
jgi:hypothetical protein